MNITQPQESHCPCYHEYSRSLLSGALVAGQEKSFVSQQVRPVGMFLPEEKLILRKLKTKKKPDAHHLKLSRTAREYHTAT